MPPFLPKVGLALLCAGVLAGCANAEPTQIAATATAPPPTVVPTATAEPEPLPSAEPFAVEVTGLEVVSTDNAGLHGGTPVVDDAEGAEAAEQVLTVVSEYLDLQLVDPMTRFGLLGIERLLGADAAAQLDDEQLRALGRLGAVEAAGAVTGPASAEVTVQQVEGTTRAVAVTFAAGIDVLDDEGAATPVALGGDLIFTRGDQGWQATLYDVRLRQSEPQPAPTPDPTTAAPPAEEGAS